MSELLNISLGVVSNKANEVLLVERIKRETLEDGSALTWAFPGGKVEPLENPEQAVVREIREETGYETAALSRIFQGRHPIAPVYVTYIACRLRDQHQKHIVNDEAINN